MAAALLIGVVLAGVAVVFGLADLQQFLRSYLWAYFFWVGLSLGCLGLALLHHVSGGAWGAALLRFFEAGMLTLPLMAILFIPIAVGIPFLYPWALTTGSAPAQGQALYLNVPFFIGRAVFYFLIWLITAFFIRRWSIERDHTGAWQLTRRLQVFSALTGVLFALTATFASIDWAMSLEPQWRSTIYGMMIVVGAILTALAFAVLVSGLLARREPFVQVLSPRLLNDFGSLLLAFVIMWAYLSFSQFMLIWAGNLLEEIPWYVSRTQTTWQVVALLVVVGNFVLPLAFLIFRDLKRNAFLLTLVAALLLLARIVNGYWLIMPAFYPNGIQFSWLDLVLPLAIGGLWLGIFFWQLRPVSLVPVGDYTLDVAVEMAHEE